MKGISILASVVMLWSGVASANETCAPVAPELAAELSPVPPPTAKGRWQLITRLWAEAAPSIATAVDSTLQSGWLISASDVIQGRTHDLLREAIHEHQDALAGSLLELWRKPLSKVAARDRLLVPYQTPDKRLSEVRLDQPQEMWLGPDGYESVLYSSVYLAGATDVAAAIARRKPALRTGEMEDFARRVSVLALSHYRRWAFGPPYIWQVRGWGCDASGLDLMEFTRRRMDRSLGNGREKYCRSPKDTDMLIAIGALNLLATSRDAPELLQITDDDRRRLLEIARLQARFMASRLSPGTAVADDGKEVLTVDFDPGAWSDHPDHNYAGDESPQFPEGPPRPSASLGWDFSHGARIAWMMLTFEENAALLGGDIDWSALTDRFANQIAYHVLDTELAIPRFRNFLDGSNGWYRVNYIGRPGSGHPPFGLSRSFLSSPWARLSPRSPRLLTAANQMWRLLAMPTQEECHLLNRYYGSGSYFKQRKPAGDALSGGSNNRGLLPFLAVAPVRRY